MLFKNKNKMDALVDGEFCLLLGIFRNALLAYKNVIGYMLVPGVAGCPFLFYHVFSRFSTCRYCVRLIEVVFSSPTSVYRLDKSVEFSIHYAITQTFNGS